ncbi:MAG: hypothetical protein A4E62_02569 [Syntrophorhabdus sp. PtaU1.Bin002]|nr:MAG: hypothetical protein A4E62_02569 [Syntrophorhabdus sp. PtaU1.Bin002]
MGGTEARIDRSFFFLVQIFGVGASIILRGVWVSVESNRQQVHIPLVDRFEEMQKKREGLFEQLW